MNKLIRIAHSLPVLVTTLPFLALAQAPPPLPSTAPVSLGGVAKLICTAAAWAFFFLIILAVVFVLIAAFKYLTASGDPEKVKGASHMLIYAVVAVAVGILARGLPLVVGSFFGATTFKGC